MNSVLRLRELVAAAAAAFRPDSGAPEIIPFGAAIVELMRANPRDREALEREFIASIGTAPPELIEFCVHGLRWQSLRSYFHAQQRQAVERNNWRAEPYFRSVLEAFDEGWEDARDFYASYLNAGA
jgi:hypothetical protein